MKYLPLKILCLLTVASLALLSAGCGTNEVVNPHQNETFSKLPPPPPPPVRNSQALSVDSLHSNKVFSYVDKMPVFPGGENALMQYLSAHIHYPAVARKEGIKETVVVQFTVNKNGSLSNIHTLGAAKGGGLEEESIAVVKNMPKWMPGSEKGVKVNVQYALPIRYVLQ